MEQVMNCWAGCGEDVAISAPVSRGSDELTEGIEVSCPECGEPYKFTVDGDGEAELSPTRSDKLGENIGDPDSTHY